MKTTLGLDLGIASVGWSLIKMNDNDDLERIIDLNTHIFSQITDKSGNLENMARRAKRASRRLLRRKVLRISDVKKLCKSELNVILDKSFNYSKYANPYVLKVKGLSEKLSNEELAIILAHYVKYRGFKSNRKVDDKSSKENGKLVKKLEELQKELSAEKMTISEHLLKQEEKLGRIHNSPGEYEFTATRQMYVDEINQVLDKQIEFGVISKEFKEKYLNIFTRQRSFADGPGEGSPFGKKDGKSLIEMRIGTCIFDKNPRAPKTAFSSESFVLLSFLNNIRYKEQPFDNYKGLTPEEIKAVYDYAKTKKEIKYADIFKLLDINVFAVKGLDISKKQRITFLGKFKGSKNIGANEKLPESFYDEFNDYCRKEVLNTKVPSLSNYYTQRKAFVAYEKGLDKNITKKIEEFISNERNFDEINKILLCWKTDDEIIRVCKEKNIPEECIEVILSFSECTETINLSLELLQKINPLLLKGMTYDKALDELGINHSNIKLDKVYDLLPPIDECMSILNEHLTNQSVRHTLVEMRKVLNAIIEKYGKPARINIEMAKDLCLGKKAKSEYIFNQIDNREANQLLKYEILSKYPEQFSSQKRISKYDLVKYKLFKEQKGYCAYSGAIINESKLFDNTEYQIDHIIPYSRSFEDGYFNKVLVSAKMNQEKGNKTPYEAFHNTDKWNIILNQINMNKTISNKKRDALLTKESDFDDWKERNLNDTKYASKLARKIIMLFLGYDAQSCLATNGQITDNMKKVYGLTGRTHSLVTDYDDYRDEKKYFIRSPIIYDSNNQIVLTVKEQKGEQIDLVIKYTNPVKDKELDNYDKGNNYVINTLRNNIEICNKYVFGDFEEKEVNTLEKEMINYLCSSNDSNQVQMYNALLKLVLFVKSEIDERTQKKNRDNHLHHALDATMIACVTPKIINNMNVFHKNNEMKIDETTGEVFDKVKLDFPYDDFRREVLLRVYERNYETLVDRLQRLSNYKDVVFDDSIKVIQPTCFPNHYKKGPLTKETMMGRRGDLIVKRVDVSTLKKGSTYNLYDETGSNKVVKESIDKWFEDGQKEKYPVHLGKGNYIKKVLVVDCDDVKKRVLVKEKLGTYADNEDVVRIDVYTKNNQIYMVPIYYRNLCSKDDNYYCEIMWAQGENGHKYILKSKIDEEFEFVVSIYRYSLIEVELKNGNKSLCYCGGCTSGQLEVYSVLGDGYDMVADRLFDNTLGRYKKTISQIKSIKLRNISILGNVN